MNAIYIADNQYPPTTKKKKMNDKYQYIEQRFVKSYMRLREERTQVHDISGKMSVHQSVGVCN